MIALKLVRSPVLNHSGPIWPELDWMKNPVHGGNGDIAVSLETARYSLRYSMYSYEFTPFFLILSPRELLSSGIVNLRPRRRPLSTHLTASQIGRSIADADSRKKNSPPYPLIHADRPGGRPIVAAVPRSAGLVKRGRKVSGPESTISWRICRHLYQSYVERCDNKIVYWSLFNKHSRSPDQYHRVFSAESPRFQSFCVSCDIAET